MPRLVIKSCNLYQLYTNYLGKFSNKIGLTIRMKIFNNRKLQDATFFKFGNRCFTFLTTLSP